MQTCVSDAESVAQPQSSRPSKQFTHVTDDCVDPIVEEEREEELKDSKLETQEKSQVQETDEKVKDVIKVKKSDTVY